jgi:hypothetical protein
LLLAEVLPGDGTESSDSAEKNSSSHKTKAKNAALRAAEKGVITPVSTGETKPITPLVATVS